MAEGEGSTRDDVLGGRMKLFASKVDSKISFHKGAAMDYMDMKYLIGEFMEEKAKMEQEAYRRLALAPPQLLEPALEQLAETNELLVATVKELDAAKQEITATKEQLTAVKEEVDEKDEQLNVITLKVQEMETMRNQDKQHNASEAALDSVQFHPSQVAGHSGSGDDDLEVLRGMLIEEFIQLDCGRCNLGVKQFGRLNRKPFHAACAAKLPPKEAEMKASELYATWEKLLKNPSWKPFKTVVVGDAHQEVIDVDDDLLQELKRTWGEDVHDSVVSALMEMRDYNGLSNRIISSELWNYKAGRKATVVECVKYLINKVNQLSVAKRRKARRMI